MNYRIEKRKAIMIVGKKILIKSTLEENYQITPKFWKECGDNGTIDYLATLMDTQLYGLMGVSVFSKKGEWEYYIAVASSKEVEDLEEFFVPESTWAIFYDLIFRKWN